MTLHEVTNQLYDLSVNGTFNGEHFSKDQLHKNVKHMFEVGGLVGGNRLVFTITLPDGEWFFYICEYAKGQFDYYIPDTREDEVRVKRILFPA